MVKIFFTRHGQTTRNVDGTIQGNEHGDLNEKGIEQIDKLADRLVMEKITKIISGDSERCKITAKGINKKLDVPIEYTELIREKDNGAWVGKDSKKVNWEELDGNFETRKTPNGESLVEARERGRKFIKKLVSDYKSLNENILVVSHGAFLKILIGDLLGMNLKNSIFKLFIDHCSLTLVEFSSKYKLGYQVKYMNENDFLGTSRNWIE